MVSYSYSYTNKLKFVRKSEQLITPCLSKHTPKAKRSLFKVLKANAITSKYWCKKYVVSFGTLWNATWFWIAFGCIVWLLRLISLLTAHRYYRIVSCIRRTFFHGGEYQKSGVRLIYEYSKTRHLFLASHGAECYRHSFPNVKANTRHLF